MPVLLSDVLCADLRNQCLASALLAQPQVDFRTLLSDAACLIANEESAYQAYGACRNRFEDIAGLCSTFHITEYATHRQLRCP